MNYMVAAEIDRTLFYLITPAALVGGEESIGVLLKLSLSLHLPFAFRTVFYGGRVRENHLIMCQTFTFTAPAVVPYRCTANGAAP